MNSNYQDIKQTLEDLECPESYIQRGLNEFGYEKFPESGLDDKGQSKLLKKILDIYHSDTSLSPREYNTKKIKRAPIKEPKKKCKSLEDNLSGEVWSTIGRGIFKTITYPTIGVNFTFPTMFRKAEDQDEKRDTCWDDDPGCWATSVLMGGLLETLAGYIVLMLTGNTKYILPIAITQVSTNILSGLYERYRSKGRADCE